MTDNSKDQKPADLSDVELDDVQGGASLSRGKLTAKKVGTSRGTSLLDYDWIAVKSATKGDKTGR